MATFGSRLDSLLKDNKLTHKELAEKLNVHKGTISNWTTDRRFPDREILLKMGEIFGVSMDYLIGVDTVQHKQNSENLDYHDDKEIVNFIELYNQLNKKKKHMIVNLMNDLLDD